MRDEDKSKALLIEELVELRRRIAKTEKAEGRDDLKILMASILDSIDHAVIGLKNRTIIFANNAVYNVFGWKPEELIGKSTRLLYRSDKEFEEIAERFYPALTSNSVHSEEYVCRHRSNRDILCRIRASRVGEELRDRMIVVSYEAIE